MNQIPAPQPGASQQPGFPPYPGQNQPEHVPPPPLHVQKKLVLSSGYKRAYAIYASVLGAIDVFFLLAYIWLGSLSTIGFDGLLIVTLCALVIALPMLAGCAITFSFVEDESKWRSDTMAWFFLVGILLTLLGVILALFHTTVILGILFVSSIIITYLVLGGDWGLPRLR